jgi:hypothetical protein
VLDVFVTSTEPRGTAASSGESVAAWNLSLLLERENIAVGVPCQDEYIFFV